MPEKVIEQPRFARHHVPLSKARRDVWTSFAQSGRPA